MTDLYPPAVQRQALLDLMPALGCRDASLRCDECGDPVINGTKGHFVAVCGTIAEPKRPGFNDLHNGLVNQRLEQGQGRTVLCQVGK
jgi:hypothetical protein